MTTLRSILAFVLVIVLVIDGRAEQPLAPSTIVVYNKAALDSAELARFYLSESLTLRGHSC